MTQHICKKEAVIEDLKKQIWDLRTKASVTDTSVQGIKDDIKRVENDMADMRKEIQDGFKGIGNKIIAAMGFVISILLTALGFLVYDSFK